MLVHHHTHRRNLSGIRAGGLKTAKSRGARKVVWLHTSSLAAWACEHMLRRRIPLADLVCVTVDVPRSWLKKTCWTGVWTVDRDIPTDRIVAVGGYRMEAVSF